MARIRYAPLPADPMSGILLPSDSFPRPLQEWAIQQIDIAPLSLGRPRSPPLALGEHDVEKKIVMLDGRDPLPGRSPKVLIQPCSVAAAFTCGRSPLLSANRPCACSPRLVSAAGKGTEHSNQIKPGYRAPAGGHST